MREKAEATRIYTASRLLADLGFHLLPVEHEGKRPLLDNWPHTASNDVAQLREWFAYVPHNIGVACGPSGLLAVDEDVRGAFTSYGASIGETIPKTFVVLTAKGTHFYFRRPERSDHGNAVGALKGRGIDIRGVGGFVVGPGSRHVSGHVYEPLDWHTPVANMPMWLEDALRPPQVITSPIALDSSGQGLTAWDRLHIAKLRTLRQLTSEISRAPEGERNATLYRCACDGFERVRCGADDEETVKNALADAAVATGLNAYEVVNTINSARRKKLEGVRA